MCFRFLSCQWHEICRKEAHRKLQPLYDFMSLISWGLIHSFSKCSTYDRNAWTSKVIFSFSWRRNYGDWRNDCVQRFLHTQPIMIIFKNVFICYSFFIIILALQQAYGTNFTIKGNDNKTCLYAELMVNFSVSYQQDEKTVSRDDLWRAPCTFNQAKLYLYVLIKYICILRIWLSSQLLQADEKLECGNVILEMFQWAESPQRILILSIQQFVYTFFRVHFL